MIRLILLLGGASMVLGCGNATSLNFYGGGDAVSDRATDAASDRAVGDGGTCKGECKCGEFGLSCARQVCTESGPVCVDAGVNDDGGRDGGACTGDLAEIGEWCPATFDGAPENVPACMAFGLQQVWPCGDFIALGLGKGTYLVDCYYRSSSHVLVGAMVVNDTSSLCGNTSFTQSAGDVPTEACRFPVAMPSLYRWCSGADSGAD